MPSRKPAYSGHGVDIASFRCEDVQNCSDSTVINILHVGRITHIKILISS